MLPHERLAQLNSDAVSAGYDVEEMHRLYSEFQEEIKELTDAQLFSHQLQAERLKGICSAAIGYLTIEAASRG